MIDWIDTIKNIYYYRTRKVLNVCIAQNISLYYVANVSELNKHTGQKSLLTGFFARFLRFYIKIVPKKNTDQFFS